MKVNEFVQTMKNNKTKSVKAVINTKDYLPYQRKVALVQSIMDKCVTEVNGYVSIDELDQYVVFVCDIIAAYTDLEFGILYWEDYDLLCENGLLGSIIDTFDDEYQMVLTMLDMEKHNRLEKNSIQYQVAGLVRKIESAVDELVGDMKTKIDEKDMNIDLGNLLKLIQ